MTDIRLQPFQPQRAEFRRRWLLSPDARILYNPVSMHEGPNKARMEP